MTCAREIVAHWIISIDRIVPTICETFRKVEKNARCNRDAVAQCSRVRGDIAVASVGVDLRERLCEV
jgi:hypothetical protein